MKILIIFLTLAVLAGSAAAEPLGQSGIIHKPWANQDARKMDGSWQIWVEGEWKYAPTGKTSGQFYHMVQVLNGKIICFHPRLRETGN